MTRITQISKEELEPIVIARTKAMDAAGVAERTLKDARVAELEFKVQIQQLYLVNGLDAICRVDISTGKVEWPNELAVPETTSSIETEGQLKKKRGKKTPEEAGE